MTRARFGACRGQRLYAVGGGAFFDRGRAISVRVPSAVRVRVHVHVRVRARVRARVRCAVRLRVWVGENAITSVYISAFVWSATLASRAPLLATEKSSSGFKQTPVPGTL